MSYVDGFLVPVPVANVEAYRKISRKAGKIWREHGALDYRECVADDLQVKGFASFSRAVRLKEGETLFFSYVVYKSRRHRDAVNKKVMADQRLGAMGPETMPFEVKRMLYGGFKTVVAE